jgi:hypothetical protein
MFVLSSVLTFHQITNDCDMVVLLDNTSLTKHLKKPNTATFNDINTLIGQMMTNLTCRFRFPGCEKSCIATKGTQVFNIRTLIRFTHELWCTLASNY